MNAEEKEYVFQIIKYASKLLQDNTPFWALSIQERKERIIQDNKKIILPLAESQESADCQLNRDLKSSNLTVEDKMEYKGHELHKRADNRWYARFTNFEHKLL